MSDDLEFWTLYAQLLDEVPEQLRETLGQIARLFAEGMERLERRIEALEDRLRPVSRLDAQLTPVWGRPQVQVLSSASSGQPAANQR